MTKSLHCEICKVIIVKGTVGIYSYPVHLEIICKMYDFLLSTKEVKTD